MVSNMCTSTKCWRLRVILCGLILLLAPAWVPGQSASSSQWRTVISLIDTKIAEVWQADGLKPSSPATDGEWCRRVHLDLIGRIPTIDELNRFLNDKSDSKKQSLVERLIFSDEYTEEFARHWTTIWSNLLIGRTGGTDNNSLISREGMQKYLRDSFARGKSYDRFVTELITAEGTTQPGSPNFNGATNFLIDKVNQDSAAQATAATSQLFLGLQVQCTQCHNHPFNDWKQQKYWELNAFFRQVRAFRGRTDADSPILADQDYPGESGRIDEADVFYELRNGLLKVAYPVFVDGTEIPKSGYVNVVNRRKELANLIVGSPYFGKAIVNRIWAHFFGYGLVNPIDDLGPHNLPSHPELLDGLAEWFVQSGYDLRQLLAAIALSQPYSLSSECNASNQLDDPQLGQPPRFSHFYLRQMTAEQLYESLLVLTGGADRELSYEEQEARRNRWLRQFTTTFGNDEGRESTTFNGTIPQILMMFNGEMTRNATQANAGILESAAAMNGSDGVKRLFLAGLSRPPTREEIRIAQTLLQARNGNRLEALQDLWWVILNSNEFIFVH